MFAREGVDREGPVLDQRGTFVASRVVRAPAVETALAQGWPVHIHRGDAAIRIELLFSGAGALDWMSIRLCRVRILVFPQFDAAPV